MQLNCESCGEPIAAEDVNLERAMAKCRACNAVFSFAERLPATPGQPDRGEVGQPERIKLHDAGAEVVFSWRWFRAAYLFLVFFAIAWDAFLIFWYSMAVSDKGPPGEMRWLMIVFPLAHVAVGVGLTYFVIAAFFNRTEVRLTAERLTVHHGPLPWPGNRDLACDDLSKLYCSEDVRRGRHGTMTRYTLNALLQDGKKVTLLSGLEEFEEALFLEQQIEARLSIPDRRVPGEIRL